MNGAGMKGRGAVGGVSTAFRLFGVGKDSSPTVKAASGAAEGEIGANTGDGGAVVTEAACVREKWSGRGQQLNV